MIKLPTEKFPRHKIDKTPTFTGIHPHVTILTILEAIRTSQNGMADEVSGNIVSKLRKRGIFGDFSEEMMQLVLEGMWNKLYYALNYSLKMSGQLYRASSNLLLAN